MEKKNFSTRSKCTAYQRFTVDKDTKSYGPDARRRSSSVLSITQKQCKLCQQQIDSYNYENHVVVCMRKQGYSLNSNASSWKLHTDGIVNTDNLPPYSESHMAANNTSGNSKLSLNINKQTKCINCFKTINESDYFNHLKFCSLETTTSRLSRTPTCVHVSDDDDDIDNAEYSATKYAAFYSKANKQTKECLICYQEIDPLNYVDHVVCCLPNESTDTPSSYPPIRHVNAKNTIVSKNSNSSVSVCSGDLITQKIDIIVVCSTSEYLFETICRAAGDSVKTLFREESKRNPKPSVIAIRASGQVLAKKIYFLEWKKNDDEYLLRNSIKKFVSDALENAIHENYQSIAFPAIGCGQLGCSVSLVAQAMVEEAYRRVSNNSISVLFVIQPGRNDIYNEFQKHINSLKKIAVAVGEGIIEVEKGDITRQQVDVIVGCSSSTNLIQAIMQAAGNDVQTAYNIQRQNNPHSILISTVPGCLPCKRIFFLEWEPNRDETKLRQSLVDRIWMVMQHLIPYNFTSIAFPAIGCGKHGCPLDVVAEIMVKEMKNQLTMRNSPLTVKFVIQQDEQNIYEKFCKQVLTTKNDIRASNDHQLPSTWIKTTENKIRFVLPTSSDEYKLMLTNFQQTMNGQYTRIIQIERIQNERWYKQYLTHSQEFKKRHGGDTEKRLYHGCPETATNLIIESNFNRSFVGENGCAYGLGCYFSLNARYSHGFASPNTNRERRMFIARVLVGKTTRGDSSMKTAPIGFDSTTDGRHIFVTYHDAQAYAEYLITYK